MKFKTLGVWLGFPGFTQMKREGIARYILYLTKYIIKNHRIQCEIWCYEINKKEVEFLFSELLNDVYYKKFIEIKTESNNLSNSKIKLFSDAWQLNSLRNNGNSVSWKLPYGNFKTSVRLFYSTENKSNFFYLIACYPLMLVLLLKGIYDKILFKINKKSKPIVDNQIEPLAGIANNFSKADCFIIPVFLLSNALQIKKPKLMALHDLHLYDYYDLFVDEWGVKDTDSWLASFDNSVNLISDYLINGKIFFVSNCDYVRKFHTLKYIKNTDEALTDFVYLPVIIPDDIDKKIISEDLIKEKYKIDSPYIFFPTQVRPYKNVITLLKALNILIEKKIKIKIVLTGKVKDSNLASRFIDENKLSDYIIQTGDVPEEDLYSLHKYAAATVVTTLFEGGIPWPALEALYMDTPVILSKIPMAIERVESIGYNIDNCGLRFFEPLDFKVLSKEIENAISSRSEIVNSQKDIKKTLLAYNWDDVSRKYYNIITAKILNNL